jgi:adenine-specific DNA methylase
MNINRIKRVMEEELERDRKNLIYNKSKKDAEVEEYVNSMLKKIEECTNILKDASI